MAIIDDIHSYHDALTAIKYSASAQPALSSEIYNRLNQRPETKDYRLSDGICAALDEALHNDQSENNTQPEHNIGLMLNTLALEASLNPRLMQQWDFLLASYIEQFVQDVKELRRLSRISILVDHNCFASFKQMVLFANKTGSIKLLTAIFDALNPKKSGPISKEKWEAAIWMSMVTAFKFEKQSRSLRKLLFKDKPSSASIHYHNLLASKLSLLDSLYKHKKSSTCLKFLKNMDQQDVIKKPKEIIKILANMKSTDDLRKLASLAYPKIADKARKKDRRDMFLSVAFVTYLLIAWCSRM